MKAFKGNYVFNSIAVSLCCTGILLYFAVLNRYHLTYLEQNQLFRCNADYIGQFFNRPGGLILLIGAFLTQFFYYPWMGAAILSVTGLFIYVLSAYIFRQIRLNATLLSLLPLLLLASLHSNHNYPLALSLGWLISLLFTAIYIMIGADKSKFVAGIVVFLLAYFLTGLFSFLTILLCILYEFLYRKGSYRFYYLLCVLLLSCIIPYLSWRFVYLIDFKFAWLSPVSIENLASVKTLLYLTGVYYPAVILVSFAVQRIFRNEATTFSWNWKPVISGSILFAAAAFMMIRTVYDRNNELFLSIDSHYHTSSWKKVLAVSEHYPGQNQLVMYYTNLALYKSGGLADNMFHYRQSGNTGLWLEWKRNETAPFFGGEVFYELGYNNEAFRWAFEAMEAKGLNPRSLKRLVMTSIINRDYEIADKYLGYLDETLFYHKWAADHRRLIQDTTLISENSELREKRKLLLKNDFIADISSVSIGLDKLLDGHPDNRMAFEYLMASYLLNKNLEAFSDNIYRIKDFGYRRIPRHYEEALVLYSGLIKKNMVPAGYTISQTTREKFHNYAQIFAENRHSMENAARFLKSDFGDTFWYYMQFMDPHYPNSNP